MLTNPPTEATVDFTQLYSPTQLSAFQLVREALIADPTALDNRGGVAESVQKLNQPQENGNGNR